MLFTALGYAALALTDECSLSGAVLAHLEAQKQQMRLIVGAEMALSPHPKAAAPGSLAEPRLALLAQTRRGYGNLAQWITLARRRADTPRH